jgi:hypothetical protein
LNRGTRALPSPSGFHFQTNVRLLTMQTRLRSGLLFD